MFKWLYLQKWHFFFFTPLVWCEKKCLKCLARFPRESDIFKCRHYKARSLCSAVNYEEKQLILTFNKLMLDILEWKQNEWLMTIISPWPANCCNHCERTAQCLASVLVLHYFCTSIISAFQTFCRICCPGIGSRMVSKTTILYTCYTFSHERFESNWHVLKTNLWQTKFWTFLCRMMWWHQRHSDN